MAYYFIFDQIELDRVAYLDVFIEEPDSPAIVRDYIGYAIAADLLLLDSA